MKHNFVDTPIGRGAHRGVATRVLPFLLVLLVIWVSAAQAAPIISGNVDQIVTVDPVTDCLGCTAQELSVLEAGVAMMLGEMHNTAIDSEVCVVEASLAKDLALVSFEAYRAGAVTESRWRDNVRYKGRFAGRLTAHTIDTMLLAFREAVMDRVEIDKPFTPIETLVLDIYASAQLARIFEDMSQGDFQNMWLPSLDDTAGGFNYEIDAILTNRWRDRNVYDEILLYSRVDAHWREAELARITTFQDDFLVGSVETERDQLLVDYRNAMAADPWGVMVNSCGAQAAAGFRRHAMELSRGIIALPMPQKQTIEPESETDKPDGSEENPFEGETEGGGGGGTVCSGTCNFFFIGRGPFGGGGGNGPAPNFGGGGGNPVNPSTPPPAPPPPPQPKPPVPDCNLMQEGAWTVSVLNGECPPQAKPGATCDPGIAFGTLWDHRCEKKPVYTALACSGCRDACGGARLFGGIEIGVTGGFGGTLSVTGPEGGLSFETTVQCNCIAP